LFLELLFIYFVGKLVLHRQLSFHGRKWFGHPISLVAKEPAKIKYSSSVKLFQNMDSGSEGLIS